jgi:perosamine synthetase
VKRIEQMEPWIEEEEKSAVMEYLKSGGWLTEFRRTRDFEGMVARYVGCKYCSVVTNGTIALTAALMASGIGKNDEVIVPDFTMIASANAVFLAGATPILVDVNRSNLCLDLNLIESVITDRTKAIVYVSFNGRCSNMYEVVDFANQHNLKLIEDAAQSLGSNYKHRHLGTFGSVGVFSFSYAKIITTGQGGALVTEDEELYKKSLMLKDFGRVKSGVDVSASIGYNFKFTDLQAVIGIEQMKKLDSRVKRKKEMYKHYQDLLGDIPQIEMLDTNLKETVPWFIDIQIQKERDKLAAFLNKKGIGTRPFYPPIHIQPPYSHTKGCFRVSEQVSQSGLWLPSSSFLSDKDIETICKEIREYFKNKN